LENKMLSYLDLLKRLEDNAAKGFPQTKKCASCGQNMHPIQLNSLIVFFIHSPEQFAECAKANPTGLKTPLIWCNKHLIRNELDKYYKEVTGKEAHSR
jgi:hypothetical protein